MTWLQITLGLLVASLGAVVIVAVCSRVNDAMNTGEHDEHHP